VFISFGITYISRSILNNKHSNFQMSLLRTLMQLSSYIVFIPLLLRLPASPEHPTLCIEFPLCFYYIKCECGVMHSLLTTSLLIPSLLAALSVSSNKPWYKEWAAQVSTWFVPPVCAKIWSHYLVDWYMRE